MSNTHRVGDLALVNGQAVSGPIDMERELGGVDGFSLGHVTGGTAGAAFLEVSHDYNRETPAAATWLTAKDNAGADIILAVVTTSRFYDTIQARAIRIRGGTSGLNANFAGNSTIQITGFTNAMGSRS